MNAIKAHSRKLAFIIVFLVVFLSLYLYSTVFVIRKVVITGTIDLKGVSRFYGQSFFFVSSNEIESELYQSNSRIKSISVQKSLPDKLAITVTNNRPVAELVIADGTLLLSTEGRIISKQRKKIASEKIPLLTYYQQLYFNQYASGEILESKDILASLLFADELSNRGIEVESIDIQNENMILLKEKEREFVFGVGKKTAAQLVEVGFVIEQMSIQGKKYKRIDFRFEKPVISY